MNILEYLYAVFLCLTREDGLGDRHKRAAAFLEMVSTFLLSFVTMLIFGFFNLTMTNFLLWGLVISVHGLSSYFLFNRYFIKSGRYVKIIAFVNQYNKRKKVACVFIAVFLVLFSFGLLIGGGIMMSYLYSLHGVVN